MRLFASMSAIFMTFSLSKGITMYSGKFEKTMVLASDLENSTSMVANSFIECCLQCHYRFEVDRSCNAVRFDDTSIFINIISTGLKVAWASSVSDGKYPWFAIDNNQRGTFTASSIFHTGAGRGSFPWLAIDLIVISEVKRVSMVMRKDCCNDKRTKNIEIWVGNRRKTL